MKKRHKENLKISHFYARGVMISKIWESMCRKYQQKQVLLPNGRGVYQIVIFFIIEIVSFALLHPCCKRDKEVLKHFSLSCRRFLWFQNVKIAVRYNSRNKFRCLMGEEYTRCYQFYNRHYVLSGHYPRVRGPKICSRILLVDRHSKTISNGRIEPVFALTFQNARFVCKQTNSLIKG